MAKKFKDYYDLECAELIADKILMVNSSFNKRGFKSFLKKELPDKEFTGRQDAFVDAFEKYLSVNYTENIDLFKCILGDELLTTEGMFIYGWWLWPVGRYIQRNGLQDYNTSIDFIYELTKRFTGEFAIRTLLEAHPKRTMRKMIKWSKDKNVHVRRLSSEGVRIKLPWAKKLTVALDEFDSFKKILTNLKSDTEKFVQKSVGNNLNDLMKEFPERAYEIIEEWEKDNPSKETLWIIKHGKRSLRKK
ncbi:MAG: DNA alkylation repair protein [Melioribacteraceae bacterium]|nr:DNA alkylation repair protein [Melioribacteraceae bacterium]